MLPRQTHPQLALTLSNVRVLCAGCDERRQREKGSNRVERRYPAMHFCSMARIVRGFVTAETNCFHSDIGLLRASLNLWSNSMHRPLH